MDPTGHIEEGEDEDARGAIDELSGYGVTVEMDWGWRDGVWEAGTWLLDELLMTLDAVKDLAREITKEVNAGSWQDNFKRVVGSVTIERRRWYKDKNGKHWRAAETAGNIVYLYNGTFRDGTRSPSRPWGFSRNTTERSRGEAKGTIVHELGHVWDNYQYGIPSDNIGWGTAGEKEPTARAEQQVPGEYWADLVMVKVYPGLHGEGHHPYRGYGERLGPRQEAYFSLTVELSYYGQCPVR